jgi:hypothetical protein
MFVLLPLAVRPIKQESMEQQFEINNQQRSLLGNHSQMNGEFPCLTLNGTTFRTDISRSQVPINVVFGDILRIIFILSI